MQKKNPTDETVEMITKIAAKESKRRAFNEALDRDQEDDLKSAMMENMLTVLPSHKPELGNLEMWMRVNAQWTDTKTFRSPLTYSRDKALAYRKLMAEHNMDYDAYIHKAEQQGHPRFEAMTAFNNYGSEQLDLFADSNDLDLLAIEGQNVEEAVIATMSVFELLELFRETCDPRALQVFTLRNQMPDRGFREIATMIEPEISKDTAQRLYKKAEAALWALGQTHGATKHIHQQDTA
jgi:hypothetical protein